MYKPIHIPLVREHHNTVGRDSKGRNNDLGTIGQSTKLRREDIRGGFRAVIELVTDGAFIKDLKVSIWKKSIRCKFKTAVIMHLCICNIFAFLTL